MSRASNDNGLRGYTGLGEANTLGAGRAVTLVGSSSSSSSTSLSPSQQPSSSSSCRTHWLPQAPGTRRILTAIVRRAERRTRCWTQGLNGGGWRTVRELRPYRGVVHTHTHTRYNIIIVYTHTQARGGAHARANHRRGNAHARERTPHTLTHTHTQTQTHARAAADKHTLGGAATDDTLNAFEASCCSLINEDPFEPRLSPATPSPNDDADYARRLRVAITAVGRPPARQPVRPSAAKRRKARRAADRRPPRRRTRNNSSARATTRVFPTARTTPLAFYPRCYVISSVRLLFFCRPTLSRFLARIVFEKNHSMRLCDRESASIPRPLPPEKIK